MEIKELLKIRLEKQAWLSSKDYDELGLYGEGFCELDYEDEDEDEDEDDEDIW